MKPESFEKIELRTMQSAAPVYHWSETGKPESGGLMQKWSTLESSRVYFCLEGYYPGKRTLIIGKLQVVEQMPGDCIAVKEFQLQSILVQEVNVSPVLRFNQLDHLFLPSFISDGIILNSTLF